MIFHEQIWVLLLKNPSDEFIDLELLYTVFRILMDPAMLPNQEIANLLEDYLEKYFGCKYKKKMEDFQNG